MAQRGVLLTNLRPARSPTVPTSCQPSTNHVRVLNPIVSQIQRTMGLRERCIKHQRVAAPATVLPSWRPSTKHVRVLMLQRTIIIDFEGRTASCILCPVGGFGYLLSVIGFAGRGN